ncbi:glycosyltransferase family 2 protein [Bifidobacterium tibiigranuli]|jgi:glycosyltransferase involved in cell wall biosynthesis|uniref:glycosyltransferase family 2 protein n=2 Tax=Bifidobacterium tibiigranuli TaxID=2172043 RepID=UPI0026EA7942|nr:glycosyltransferase family 2 protein [Bifidobacterium tibiigranuli]MCI1661132.1 glycosyltransferase [Bifidobacterium psychraerophilum]MCI2204186.1 glycosyltransferase [Bifidobacterium tibiigranuli]
MMSEAEAQTRPLISVIVPVYKVEKYLDQCVESIVNQTYQNLEIILIDDGSPDRCPQICDEWAAKDPRVRVIHRANGGLSAARNSGLAAAQGTLIGFVDSDDWIAPDMYQSMANNLMSTGADIAYTASAHVYEDGTISTRHLVNGIYLDIDNGEAFKYINLPGFFGVAAWDKLIRREVIGDLLFPDQAKRDEDYGFAYATLDRAEHIVYDSMPKYFYRQSQGTLSNTASTIGTRASSEMDAMVKLVRRKYPQQLPYALYGRLLVMMGTWDQVAISGQACKGEWRKFREELIVFIRANLNEIRSTVTIPRVRLIQIQLFERVPALYLPIFRIFKWLHPHRVG